MILIHIQYNKYTYMICIYIYNMILIHIQYIINTPICDIYNMILTLTIYIEYTYMTYDIYIYIYT